MGRASIGDACYCNPAPAQRRLIRGHFDRFFMAHQRDMPPSLVPAPGAAALRSLGPMILRGERSQTTGHARLRGEHFKVNPGVSIR